MKQVMMIELIMFLFLAITGTQTTDCPYDLSPCRCSSHDLGISLMCDFVPMEAIKSVFGQTEAIDIRDITIQLIEGNNFIPADLLGQSRITDYLLIDGWRDALLTIDPDALRSSMDTLQILHLRYLDMTELDFSFLSGFGDQFYSIDFHYQDNLENSLLPTTLPYLPGLTQLSFTCCSDVNKLFTADFALQSNGLKFFSIDTARWKENTPLNDEGMSGLVDWLLSTSKNTLNTLDVSFPNITKTPPQLGSFQQLNVLNMFSNQADLTLSTGSIYSAGNASLSSCYSSITDSRIVSVEPGAFKGNYSNFCVNLHSNLLTRFEADSFQSMLQQMTGGEGRLDVERNPFDCYSDPCHLAWLLRDNRHLLKKLEANCYDDVSFAALSPDLFKNCP